MKYDEILCREYAGYAVEYGIAWGGPVVVFVKAGRGGSCFGFEDKYLKMAHLLKERWNCSVICASNPAGAPATVAEDGALLRELFPTADRVYAVGSSNGAYQVLELAKGNPNVKNLLTVNLPLMINTHKIKDALFELCTSDRRVFCVWGECDPSAPYVRFIENLHLQNCRTEILPRADHCFSDMTDAFVQLPNRLFELV